MAQAGGRGDGTLLLSFKKSEKLKPLTGQGKSPGQEGGGAGAGVSSRRRGCGGHRLGGLEGNGSASGLAYFLLMNEGKYRAGQRVDAVALGSVFGCPTRGRGGGDARKGGVLLSARNSTGARRYGNSPVYSATL